MDNLQGETAVVEYSYTAKEPDELDLVKGAIIHSVKRMSGGWWEGTLESNGKTGMFPDNFVRVLDMNDDNTVTLRDKITTVNRRCKVIYSYSQVNDDELSLKVGDVIDFLGEVEEGWWRGRLRNKIGVFPSNFVIAIESSPVLASKRPPSIKTITASIPPPSSTITSTTTVKSIAANTPAPTTITTKTTETATLTNKSITANALNATQTTTTTTTKLPTMKFHNSKENLLNDELAPSLPPKPQRDYCRVEFPYAPQNEDELELKVGDIIAIIKMDLPDKGWWKGELNGKIGCFPDNFVKLISVASPLNDLEQSAQQQAQQQQQKGHVKISNTTAANTTATSSSTSSSSNSYGNIVNNTSAKVLIKKSGSTSSTQSSNPKDSFGSRDSLNDILSETGLQSGNVAAQRKSLENKNLDLSNPPDAGNRIALKKQQLQKQQHQMQDTKNTITSTTAATTTTAANTTSPNTNNHIGGGTSLVSTQELRKSLENIDDKTKSPPPVLTKKPMVPKKSSTSVAGNLLSGFKSKVKNAESKLMSTASHDYADGIGNSKMSPSGLPETGVTGNIVMKRAATIAVTDSEFDHVERTSMLPDMRAGRVRAPKRRPPSTAINVLTESNNNETFYINGSLSGNDSGGDVLSTSDDSKLQSSDDNSIGDEHLAKPKPREWEKKKAPWMEELKASQVRKKTSPNNNSTIVDRTSKLLPDDIKITSSTNPTTTMAASVTNNIITNNTIGAVSSTTTKLQSSTITSSNLMHQSISATTVDNSNSNSNSNSSMPTATTIAAALPPTATITATTPSTAFTSANNNKRIVSNLKTINNDDLPARPNSLSLRNRSMSPSQIGEMSQRSINKMTEQSTNVRTNAVHLNNHSQENSIKNSVTTTTTTTAAVAATTNGDNDCNHERVDTLERRIDKLELVVHTQQKTIDELVRLLREETDRVRVLRGELDKYAQCVTQV